MADHVVALGDLLAAAHFDAHGSVELEGAAARRRLRGPFGVARGDRGAQLVDEHDHAVAAGDRSGEATQSVGHQARLQAHLALADRAVDLRLRRQRRHRVDDDDVHGAAAHQRLEDEKRLFAAVRLRQVERFDLHAQCRRETRIESVFGVDEGRHAAGLLRFGNGVQRQRGLAAALRSEDLDDAAAGKTADAERHVQRQDARGDHFHVCRVALAEAHDRTVAELAADVVERLLENVLARQFFALFCFSQGKFLQSL